MLSSNIRHFANIANNRFASARFIYALLIALFVATSLVGPAYAQSAPPAMSKEVKLLMQDGWQGRGHQIADDFVLVCPNYEVLDPQHPCSEASGGQAQLKRFNDLVLVCPSYEVLDDHPCAERRAQVKEAKADDLVLVCPIEEVLGEHPCAEKNFSKIRIPNDFVMTCPVKEVLDPKHPCAE